MKVILFGATGMVGQGVLRECLRDDGIEGVLAVGRSSTYQTHPKLSRTAMERDRMNTIWKTDPDQPHRQPLAGQPAAVRRDFHADRAVRRDFDQLRRDRPLQSLPVRLRRQLPRLPEVRRLAGRVLQLHQRLPGAQQFCRRASVRLRSRRDAGGRAGERHLLPAAVLGREPAARRSGRQHAASGRRVQLLRGPGGREPLEPVPIPRRLRQPGEIDFQRTDAGAGRGLQRDLCPGTR